MSRLLFTIILIVACATGAVAGPREDADDTFGRGDYTKAAQLLRPYADQGDTLAQLQMGLMYDEGLGVTQDYQEAMKWFQRSAKQGFVPAQNVLGLKYHFGRGIRQDLLAYMWLNIAAAALSGDERKEALKNRDHVASQMTTAQIEKAQEMARRCHQSKFKECD